MPVMSVTFSFASNDSNDVELKIAAVVILNEFRSISHIGIGCFFFSLLFSRRYMYSVYLLTTCSIQKLKTFSNDHFKMDRMKMELVLIISKNDRNGGVHVVC